MKTAVVIGSTGLIGSALIEKLVHDPSYGQILAILRKRPREADSAFTNARVRCLEFDFQKWPELELQLKSFIGSQPASFFCSLGTTIKQAGSEGAFKKVDYTYAVEFAKLAKSCHAENLLVVSALGADKASPVFYNRIKGEAEFAISEIFKEKLYFLRPSLLLGDRKDFRFGERVTILLAPFFTPLLVGPLNKYRPIAAELVAQAMLNIATKKINASTIVSNDEIFRAAALN